MQMQKGGGCYLLRRHFASAMRLFGKDNLEVLGWSLGVERREGIVLACKTAVGSGLVGAGCVDAHVVDVGDGGVIVTQNTTDRSGLLKVVSICRTLAEEVRSETYLIGRIMCGRHRSRSPNRPINDGLDYRAVRIPDSVHVGMHSNARGPE